MSDHMQKEIKTCISDDESLLNSELQQSPVVAGNAKASESALMYDQQNSLVEIANSTFRELCKTLESEQAKLMELEERRKKLQEEMLLLKAEIEEEKQSFNTTLKKSVAENLSLLNESSGTDINDINIEKIITCYEEDEQSPVTARNLDVKDSRELVREQIPAEEHSQQIKQELQNVLTECIIEQYADKTE